MYLITKATGFKLVKLETAITVLAMNLVIENIRAEIKSNYLIRLNKEAVILE